MKSEDRIRAKQLYKELRRRSWDSLWNEEVPRFNAADDAERAKMAGVIRAVGVVFQESGLPADREKIREWLRALLNDPSEKVRRYAIAAMPKIGAGVIEEQKLLSALGSVKRGGEQKIIARTLGKIGGTATLKQRVAGDVEQKVKASLARLQNPSAVRVKGVLSDYANLRINLRGRNGLEQFVSDEVKQSKGAQGKFLVANVKAGNVTIVPTAPFSITDIYAMRCFGTIGFVLGSVAAADDAEALSGVITSKLARRLLETFTTGAIRYRINFAAKGHQRAAVKHLANCVYARHPEFLNDGRNVTWTIDIYPHGAGQLVELRPNLTPDPRFLYRKQDVPAASHPQLAACLARLAGRVENEVVWDPFCGSGLELIERALLGGVRSVYGTDISAEAIEIAQKNFAAANVGSVRAEFICSDFRKIVLGGMQPTLIITNPPMGMRVPVADLRQLIANLFTIAAKMLKPGGRLVFVNPLSNQSPHPLLKLQFQQKVDMGGFECRMEKYFRVGPAHQLMH